MSSPEKVIAQLEAELGVARKWGERSLRELHKTMLMEIRQADRRLRRAEERAEAAKAKHRETRRRALVAERELQAVRASSTWRAGRAVVAVPSRIKRFVGR